MKISEARKGLRVQLTDEVKARYADIPQWMEWHPRHVGTLRSGRVLRLDTSKGYEEGLVVYVKWDAMPTAEAWHLTDLVAVESGALPAGDDTV